MTTYDDNPLAVRFAALAPEPLPEDWDDVLGRAGAFRPHRHRLGPSLWRGGRRRMLVVALAAAALVAVAGTAAYGTVRVLLLDKGFIGLPPVGATPSAPESGELVVQWQGNAPPVPSQQGGYSFIRTWVYADGRVIWDRRPHSSSDGKGGIPEGANEFNSGYLEQRLAPEGVQLVRAAVAELLDRSRALVEEIPAGDDPWWGNHPRLALIVPDDYVSRWGLVAVPDGDRSARLLWGNFGHDDSVFEGTRATPEQLSAIRRLYALLTDPAAVLPSSAWAVRKISAYVPSHYAVCIDTQPSKDASDLLSLLPARAAELLHDKSTGSPPGGGPGRSVDDCYTVETEEAREVADALSGLVREERSDVHGLRWRLDETVDGQSFDWSAVSIEPYFPDGRIPFSAEFG